MAHFTKPAQNEYPDYFDGYLQLLKDDSRDVLDILKKQGHQVDERLATMNEDQAAYRYASDKWSIKELLGHIIDMDRLFAFRALWVARCDPSLQPSIDENHWAMNSNAHQRSLPDIRHEYAGARLSHIQLFGSFDYKVGKQDNPETPTLFSLNSLPWIMAAHELHHLKVLRERYDLDFLT